MGRRTDETPILTQRRVRVVERVEVFRPISLALADGPLSSDPLTVSSFLEVGLRIVWNSAIGPSLHLERVWTNDKSSFSVLALQYHWFLSHS